MGRAAQNIAVLILAAGASTRMGGNIKQLLPWKGTTLLGNAINTAILGGFKDIFVVLGANKEVIREQHQHFAVDFIENKDWQEGLGSSLACGVKFLQHKIMGINTILVMLADQPLIGSEYLKSMRVHFQCKDDGIVATDYGNRVGVPAIFAKPYFSSLGKLNKDFGAQELLIQHKSNIFIMHSTPNIIDIDTMEDYLDLNNNII